MYGNHFTFEELVVTSTHLDNTPATDEHLANLADLWQTLNYVREEFNAPILVNSAYRTPAVNRAVGGVRTSYHLQGRAADIRPKDSTRLDELYKLLCNYNKKYGKFVELFKRDTFIHLAI